MGDCGLRVAEALDVYPGHISRMSDGRHYTLEVGGRKDTSGIYSRGKHRETWLPVDLEHDSNRYSQHHEIARDEVLLDRSKRTLQYWVENVAARVADETGDFLAGDLP